jgi:hypothetical protein
VWSQTTSKAAAPVGGTEICCDNAVAESFFGTLKN